MRDFRIDFKANEVDVWIDGILIFINIKPEFVGDCMFLVFSSDDEWKKVELSKAGKITKIVRAYFRA